MVKHVALIPSVRNVSEVTVHISTGLARPGIAKSKRRRFPEALFFKVDALGAAYMGFKGLERQIMGP